MFLRRCRRNEDIVYVHVTKIEIAQNLINKSLKRRVPQFERHVLKFAHAERRDDIRLWHVSSDGDLMVRSHEIEGCKDRFTL